MGVTGGIEHQAASRLTQPDYSPDSHSSITWRLAALVALLPVELLTLALRFDGAGVARLDHWWARWISYAHFLPQILIAIGGGLLVLHAGHVQTFTRTLVAAFDIHRQRYLYLLGHLVSFAALFVFSQMVFEGPHSSAYSAMAWTAAAGFTLLFWLTALAPFGFWIQQFSLGRRFVGVGAGVGLAAWGVGQLATLLWEPLAGATHTVAEFLLRLFYADVESSATDRTIGVSGFSVQIAPDCSGLEGIGLILVFLSAYLWFFRDRHRFPQVLVLYPIGMVVIWLVNALRIALLVVIGAEISPAIAVQGFHSQAGWVGFTAVSLAVVAVAGRVPFVLKKSVRAPANGQTVAVTTPSYLLPAMTLLVTVMITGAVATSVDWLYPLRIVAAVVVLGWFRKSYQRFYGRPSMDAIGIGVAVFFLWLALEPVNQDGGGPLKQGLSQMSTVVAVGWLCARVLGSVIVIPVVEELAFRGYLVRRLTAAEFEKVPFTPLAISPVLVSSVAFGLLHGRWLAGTLAGLAYAWALHQRGELSDPIAAHMTTNALIAIAVLGAGFWGLWV